MNIHQAATVLATHPCSVREGSRPSNFHQTENRLSYRERRALAYRLLESVGLYSLIAVEALERGYGMKGRIQ